MTPQLNLPAPTNTAEFLIVAICATPLIALLIWLKFGEKKSDDNSNRISDNGNGHGSQTDQDRIKRVEDAIKALWYAVDKIKDKQSDNTIDVMRELNEIKLMVVSAIHKNKLTEE